MIYLQPFFLLLCFTFIINQAVCQELPDKETQLNQAIESLFEHLGEDTFDTKLTEVKKLGASQQALLEFEFLNNIETNDTSALAKMAKRLEAQSNSFDPDVSQVFAEKDDWLSIIHYTKALAALENNNEAEFKANITEAFWLSPQQGQIFTPHIEAHRLKKAMTMINFDFSISPLSQTNKQPKELSSLIGDSPAILLHFWSPLIEQVHINAEDFVATSIVCEKNNIPTVSILIEHNKETLILAEEFRNNEATKAQCTWLLDLNKKSLASQLKISRLPTMVLISSKGKVLFNGQPADDEFWHALSNIAPQLKRPNKPNDSTKE